MKTRKNKETKKDIKQDKTRNQGNDPRNQGNSETKKPFWQQGKETRQQEYYLGYTEARKENYESRKRN